MASLLEDRGALAPLYEAISRTAIHTVKPEHVATFLGRRLTQNFSAELGNDFNTRIPGTRIRHSMGKQDRGRTYMGFNFLSYHDRDLLLALVRGKHVITGFRHLDVQLPRLSSGQVSRHLKRLRVHGLINALAAATCTTSPNSVAAPSSPASNCASSSCCLSSRQPLPDFVLGLKAES